MIERFAPPTEKFFAATEPALEEILSAGKRAIAKAGQVVNYCTGDPLQNILEILFLILF